MLTPYRSDLIGNAELVQRRIQPVEQGLQALFFVVDGDDDGKIDGTHRGSILQYEVPKTYCATRLRRYAVLAA